MKTTSIILATASVLLCASSVEMFKFGKSAPPPPPPPPPQAEQVDYAQPMYLAPPPTRYYPMPAEMLRQPLMAEPQYAPPAMKGFEFHASKSFGKTYAPAAAPLLASPQPLAYLVVRPIPSALRPQLETRYPQPQAVSKLEQDTKGGRPLAVQEPVIEQAPQFEQQQQQYAYYQPQPVKASSYGVKGAGRQSEEQAEQQIQQIEQQHEQITEEQQQQQQQQQPALIVPVAPGKEGKLRAILDKLMSKLTLGSSYQVVSEEIVAPQQQQALPAAPIQQQQIEQQQLTNEDQRLEQQLEQQRDNGFEEGATKQVKASPQPIAQEQLKEEPIVQLQQSAVSKGQQQQQQQLQEIFRQEPLEVAPVKVIKQQLPTISQEPLRQEAKGTY